MIFNTLHLKHYRKFNDRKIRFTGGLNLLLGANEAGKSTVSEALMDVLFSDPTSKAKALTQRIASWGSDAGSYLMLEFEHNAEEWQLEKDFGKGEARLVNLTRHQTYEGTDAVHKQLLKLLPVGSEAMYSATARIAQSDIAVIKTDKDFTAAIQNAVSAGNDGGVVTVISTLDQQLKELRKGTDRLAKNPGPIKTAQDEVAHLEAELSQKQQQWKKVNTARDEGLDSGSKINELQEKAEQTEQLIENHTKRKEGQEKLSQVQSRLHAIQNVLSESSDLMMQREKLVNGVKQYAQFESQNIEEVGRKITGLSEQRQALKKEIESMPAQKQAPEPKKPSFLQKNQHLLAAAGVLLLGVIMAVVLQSPVVGGIGLLIAVVMFFVLRVQVESNDAQVQAAQQLAQQYAYKQEAFKQASKSLDELLSQYKVDSEENFYAKKAEHTGLKQRLAEVDARLEGMLSGKSADELRAEQVELLTTKKEIEQNQMTADVLEADLSPEDLLRKRRELDMLKLELKREEQRNTASKVRQEDAPVDREMIISLEEQLANAKQRLEHYSRQEKIQALVMGELKSAVKKTAKSAGKTVSDGIERYLKNLTKGRYTEARVRDDLSIQVFSADKNDWVNPTEVLSAGATDQVYFLARLAFLKTITGKESLPLILDDPFVTFDASRRQQVKKILEEYKQEHQVVFMTHYPEYEDWADNIVSVE